MKALVLEEVEQALRLVERPPLTPASGEVVVSLRAAALNRRDYFITRGLYPGIRTPSVLGSDGAGVVSSVGPGVEESWLNAEVILDPGQEWGSRESVQSGGFQILGMPNDGTFASEIVVPVGSLHRRPKHLSWEQAASLPLAGVTAYRALFSQGGLSAGENVLVTGVGGGVATFALQFAVAAGANVWVTSSSDEKISRAESLGAKGGVNYRSASWAKDLVRVGGAPRLVIDGAGGDGYANLIEIAAPGARIVSYGATAGSPRKLELFRVFWKQLRLIGSTLGSPRDFQEMVAFTAKHEVWPVVDAVFPLAEGNHALGLLQTSPQFGKYVLDVSR